MIEAYLFWTSAYVTGMAHQYDRDHKRLASDSIEFYKAMKLASDLAFPPKMEPIANLRDEQGNESPAQQDGLA
ncbi:MAG: hypothetical protein E6R03_11375 [Hyphomicrobiaceae bacterium]|nr:MAG: hypothetical protein E6R03_11375 [Hyphomicrobiaceae bacterium]